MKDLIKSLISRAVGFDPSKGEPISLTPGGGARTRSTVNPNPGLGFNDFAQSLHRETKRIGAGPFGR